MKTLKFFLYNNMCTYNTISSHTDHLRLQKRESKESKLAIFLCLLYFYAQGVH